MKAADLINARFDRWSVVGRAPNNAAGQARWHCKCDCGKVGIVSALSLKAGTSRSCGCLTKEVVSAQRFKHGRSGTPEYRTWVQMHKRCTNETEKMYHRYGGRGIGVCERWSEFSNFFSDMGEKPSVAHSLERKDNNANYGPENCCWATKSEQARNRIRNHLVVYRNQTVPLIVALEMAGNVVKHSTARARLARGWSIEMAVESAV